MKLLLLVSSDSANSLRDQADFLAPMLPLSANVVYPTMAVVDARAEGTTVGHLFRSLRLVQLNAILCSDLSERECAYNAGTIDETDPEKVSPLALLLGCARIHRWRRCWPCCRLSFARAT
jgi:hypothetical protein